MSHSSLLAISGITVAFRRDANIFLKVFAEKRLTREVEAVANLLHGKIGGFKKNLCLQYEKPLNP